MEGKSYQRLPFLHLSFCFTLFSSAADLSFMEVCRGSTIQILNFADAVAIGSRSPERLLKILDVFETLRDLMPEFESVFSDQYCLFLQNEAITIWKRLGEAIRGIFMELENLITCRSRQTLQQVTDALRKEGLESSNLIVRIDFTKSNEWTGKVSFRNRSLHAIGDEPNPYEKAISIIEKTLAPFDEDNLIPCFDFGDATTHDQEVFSFHNDHSPCHGFEKVLACYKRILPNLRLSGLTSYGPVVEAAMDIVEKSGGQYHVLVIIADGQVTRSIDTSDNELSPQEQKTIGSIADASFYPLSSVLVGVGGGPWEDMRKFNDKLPSREFDNFQFVNFTEIMSKHTTSSEKETAFALAALMEIPIQYKAAVEFGILGRTAGKKKKIVPRPPPVTISTTSHHLHARKAANPAPATGLAADCCDSPTFSTAPLQDLFVPSSASVAVI
ncbi:E3 ubiquitin-protein ligase RGLG2-like [Pyrus ussuriensis x Pyrus communis]|uniref:E3 ubiquitin-protein ligase RGLG2-like n=1 Tax=Pyrus ussuriensis x Pyrus communis TaxID=2448454 RepID=A0A5N5IDF4_9ROSA|nr:E3 ubiquitin-protein ligase RGLG2-like [Pyrus ussuriensis x Pyrus communis]